MPKSDDKAKDPEDRDDADAPEPDSPSADALGADDDAVDDESAHDRKSAVSEIGLLRDPDAVERSRKRGAKGDKTDADLSADDFLGGGSGAGKLASGQGSKAVVVNVMFDRDIDDAALDELGRVGFEIHEKFDVFPIVTGSIDAASVKALSSIEGVTSVEENRELGPA